MVKNNGMWLDGNPNAQPPNTSRENKNIIFTNDFNQITNEKGFTKIKDLVLTPIGKIILDSNRFIVFSTDDVSSEIGLMSNDEYKIIYSNAGLKFKKANPIHGKFFVNNRNQCIITWTDGVQPLRSLNIDIDNETTGIEQINTFNPYLSPKIKATVQVNGQLKAGSYIPVVRFIHLDGSTTNFIKEYNPVYIENEVESGLPTNKNINLEITDIDTKYNQIEIGYVYETKGVKTAHLLKRIKINGSPTLFVTITGKEVAQTVDVTDIIIDNANYKTIQHITVFDDQLIGINVSEHEEPDFSKLIKDTVSLKWISKPFELQRTILTPGPTALDPVTSITINYDSFKDSKHNIDRKGFAHDEVYAFYVRFKWSWGYGKWFLIWGRIGTDVEKALIADSLYRNYQINDTCSIITNPINALGIILDDTILPAVNTSVGNFSYWENEADGVRHHKFPSMKWMRENVYVAGGYGTVRSDTLGIKIDINSLLFNNNGETPQSYQIGYAKREDSSRVVGQSIVINNSRFSPNKGLVSSGGNWKISTETTDVLRLRTYPFEILRDKQKRNVNYIRHEYTLSVSALITDLTNIGLNSAKIVLTDYLMGSSASSPVNAMFEVESTKLIPNNTIIDDFNNVYLEEFLDVKLKTASTDNVFIRDGFKQGIIASGTINETTGLITLLNVQKNHYLDYANQEIIKIGNPFVQNMDYYFGGDVFINDYSINTYGVQYQLYTSDEKAYTDNPNTLNYKKNGIRAVKRFLVESKFNINMRYVNDKFEYSTSYYPEKGTTLESSYLNQIPKDINPNDFVNGYDSDFNTLNDISYSNIFDTSRIEETKHIFRIVSSTKLNRDIIFNNWRDFKLNDYKEVTSEKGLPMNLEVLNDSLLIHFENSLYKTRPRGTLQTSEGVPIQLGFGNILEFDPVPVLDSELGELGTKHKWSCLLTKYGYCFYDVQKGIWFMLNNDIKVLSNKGLFNHFKNNKDIFGDNAFVGNGVSVMYDEAYNRLIVSKKSKRLPDNLKNKFKGVWKNDINFVNSLRIGDIVYKDNKYLEVL